MEILILGILLVALMVWASTRIKRNAAAAFDAETVETEQFAIKKADGWLSKVEPTRPFLFEAYSKDFGVEPNQGTRMGNATVEVFAGSIDEIAIRETSDGEITDDVREVVAETHYRIVELTREDNEVEKLEWLKFAQAAGTVYTFRITVLAEATAEFRRDVEAMVDSFEIK